MTSAIRHIPADSAEYAKDYTNGWRASQRADDWDGQGLSPLERADLRNVSHAWYDGWEDWAVGNAKWTKRNERLAGDWEPETATKTAPDTQVNPTVTMRLTHREFVLFVANHSNHFTCEAGKRIAGKLAEGTQFGYSARRKIVCHAHGDSCTAEYDNGDGFYWVTTTAYATADEAWRDTVTNPPLG